MQNQKRQIAFGFREDPIQYLFGLANEHFLAIQNIYGQQQSQAKIDGCIGDVLHYGEKRDRNQPHGFQNLAAEFRQAVGHIGNFGGGNVPV